MFVVAFFIRGVIKNQLMENVYTFYYQN